MLVARNVIMIEFILSVIKIRDYERHWKIEKGGPSSKHQPDLLVAFLGNLGDWLILTQLLRQQRFAKRTTRLLTLSYVVVEST